MVCLLEFGPPFSDVCMFLSLEQCWFCSGGIAADFALGLVIQSFNAPSVVCTCFVLVYQWFWTTGDCDTLWMVTLSLLLVLCFFCLLNRLFY